MNIKEGDIIICINDGLENDTISKSMLTFGKSYIVIMVDKWWQSPNTLLISVENDLGIIYSYYDFRFRSLVEYRRKKLEMLNSISE